jgi:hypothetical protein
MSLLGGVGRSVGGGRLAVQGFLTAFSFWQPPGGSQGAYAAVQQMLYECWFAVFYDGL